MAVDVGQLIGGALGGAVASSVLGPLVLQRNDRRELRAAALRALGVAESARWAPAPKEAYREAIVAFRAAALVASLDRRIVDRYADVSWAARRVSEEKAEQRPDDDEWAGAIPGDLGGLVSEVADLVVASLWRPWRSRLRRASTLGRLEVQRLAVMANHLDEPFSSPDFWRRAPY